MLITLVGPESTGKTTLAGDISRELSAPLVDEFAREYIGLRASISDFAYTESDVLSIARTQWEREQQAIHGGSQHVVLDTDLLVIKIWWQVRYGTCHPWIVEHLERQPARLYLLTSPDMDWEADPLRENPQDRNWLFDLYKRELESMDVLYEVVSGDRAHRLNQAMKRIRVDLTS